MEKNVKKELRRKIPFLAYSWNEMKKIILILTTAAVIFITNNCLAERLLRGVSTDKKISFERNEIKKLFLDNPLSGSKYDPTTGKVYGLSSSNGVWYFASIDIGTGKIEQLKSLPEVMKFGMGNAAVDREQRRYFFVGSVKGNWYLYILNIDTGEMIYRYKLRRPFKFIAYFRRTDRLYGLSEREGTYYFISFDIYSGRMAEVSKLSKLSRLKGTSRKIDSRKGVFLFEGVFNGRNSLLAIDIPEGRIKAVNAFRVSVNDYRIHFFGRNQPVNMLYTFGVGNCVVAAGYCKTCGAGFLAHFSPRFEKIEETLGQIEKEIKTKGGKSLAEMNIYVVGGRIRNAASYKNAIKVYQVLAEMFGTTYKGDRIFHLGIVYNIIIDNGNIDIFF
ncbi:MAG: hypothetical protein GTO45_33675 [Candidatus Aminicenantes bacterium]|nr:hypothetical protein [Candidatus Aminicenantes bacterium]NIM83660.1 hypothetical protein [Candidatus Aminicenantes bacterium]NIN23084.1 hypothetical protein [Candidatus Aminicenantes bacterium]NIN46811.1 hypothetical protein [Candidatus Aminicenantes bacterium]NIN89733.1 hypothetical protein [Candidatus Aminicenantes bacterium]